MRGARFERAVGESWPATPAKLSYGRRASATALSRSWSRAALLSRSLLSRCWRLKSEQHHGKHCGCEQRAGTARGTDSHAYDSITTQ